MYQLILRKYTLFFIFFVFYQNPLFAIDKNSTFDKVTLRADIWCPYNCEPNSTMPGLMIEVAQRAYGKENLDYQLMPWKNAITDTRNGLYDAIVGASYTDAKDFNSSYPIGRSVFCFYTDNKSTWKYTNHASLNGRKLGLIESYSYPDFVLNYVANEKNKGLTFVKFGNGVLIDLLNMLVSREKIDTVIDEENVLSYNISIRPEFKSSLKNVGCANDSFDVAEIGISFPPKSQIRSVKLLKQLNLTIKEMIENGEMEKLTKKYKIKKWW